MVGFDVSSKLSQRTQLGGSLNEISNMFFENGSFGNKEHNKEENRGLGFIKSLHVRHFLGKVRNKH